MKMLAEMSLKTHATLLTGGIILLVLVFNTLVNIHTAAEQYRTALIARVAVLPKGSARMSPGQLGRVFP